MLDVWEDVSRSHKEQELCKAVPISYDTSKRTQISRRKTRLAPFRANLGETLKHNMKSKWSARVREGKGVYNELLAKKQL